MGRVVSNSITNITNNFTGSSNSFNVKDTSFAGGAKGDGSTNDTAAIKAAYDAAVAAGGGVVEFPSGIYLSDGIAISAAGIVFKGVQNGVILRRRGTATAQNYLLQVGAETFASYDIEYDGNNSVANTVDACTVRLTSACTRAHFFRCGFMNANGTNANGTGHGVLTIGQDSLTSRFDFVECYASGNDAEGFLHWYADNIHFLRCASYSNGRNGFACDFRNNPNMSERFSYVDCDAYSNGSSGFTIGVFADSGVNTHNNPTTRYGLITGCKAFYNDKYGIAVYGDYHTVTFNHCYENNQEDSVAGGIVFSARGSICSFNVCNDNSSVGGYGIDSGGTADCVIEGNLCYRNYINFNPGGSRNTTLKGNHSYDYYATGCYIIPVEGGGGSSFPYECTQLIMDGNIWGVHAAGKLGLQLLYGVRDCVFKNNHFPVYGTGRLQDLMFWNGDESCVMTNNTHSVTLFQNYSTNEAGNILKLTDIDEYVVNTQTNPLVNTITTWSRDTIGSNVISHLKPGAYGTGYTTATVSFSGGGGSGAAATAKIYNGTIIGYDITNRGVGYTSAPTVTITGDGTGATATAVRNYQVPTNKRLRIYANSGMTIAQGTATMPFSGSLILGSQDFVDFCGQYGNWRFTGCSRRFVNPTRKTTSGNITLGNDDTYTLIKKSTSAITTVTLPATPNPGQIHVIKDLKGDADIYNITIDGNGHNIDNLATYTIDFPFGAVALVYDNVGTEWAVVNEL